MVYGWGSERFPIYYAFYEMKGMGHALGGPPGVPRSMSLNVPYHKELDKVPSGAHIPPDHRYRQFLKSTKYVALTLEMAVICFML